jgi:hypothetical protein
VSIGNTPGPYTLTGNRISNNGRYGYRACNLRGGDAQAADAIVLEGNDVWGNALDGVRIDFAAADPFVVGNRIRDNGVRSAPGASGGGASVHVASQSLTDETAGWPRDGHRGKPLRIDGQEPIVIGNDATTLHLAPYRPGAPTAWRGDRPADGAPYELPDAPATRAGIAINAATHRATIRGNRVWGQTHGLWITADGSCDAARSDHNDLTGNADGAARFDTQPAGGDWHHNAGLDDC